MSYQSEPDNHIRNKVRVVLDLLNYASKKKLEHATFSYIGASAAGDTFNLAAKKILFI